MAEITFKIDEEKFILDFFRELNKELGSEFESILQILKSNLDLSKTISQLPDHWVSDVVDHLRYLIRYDAPSKIICSTIGVFNSDNGLTVERPQDVLWKAMIINYGMGIHINNDNEYLKEYESSNDFNTIRTELSPKYNIATRHDAYYDPELKRYVMPDTANEKADKLIPQFSHRGNAWWSDVYAKFLDAGGRALTMIDNLIDRVMNRMDLESYFHFDGFLDAIF